MRIVPAAPAVQQTPCSWADLAPQIRERLASEGLDTPAAWRAAGRRRLQVFGITRAQAKRIDALAKAEAQ